MATKEWLKMPLFFEADADPLIRSPSVSTTSGCTTPVPSRNLLHDLDQRFADVCRSTPDADVCEELREDLHDVVQNLGAVQFRELLSTDSPVFEFKNPRGDMVARRFNVFAGKNTFIDITYRPSNTRFQTFCVPTHQVFEVLLGTIVYKNNVVEAPHNPSRDRGNTKSKHRGGRKHTSFSKFVVDGDSGRVKSKTLMENLHLSLASRVQGIPGTAMSTAPHGLQASKAVEESLEIRIVHAVHAHGESKRPDVTYCWADFEPGAPSMTELKGQEAQDAKNAAIRLFCAPRQSLLLSRLFHHTFLWRLQGLERAVAKRFPPRLAPSDTDMAREISVALSLLVKHGHSLSSLGTEIRAVYNIVDKIRHLVMYRFDLNIPRQDGGEAAIRARLNMFPSKAETYIHNHSTNMISTCLWGGYEHKIWSILPRDTGSSSTRCFRRFRDNITKKFGQPELVDGVLSEPSVHSHCINRTYFLDQSAFHTVSVRAEEADGILDASSSSTLTLFFKDKVVRPSQVIYASVSAETDAHNSYDTLSTEEVVLEPGSSEFDKVLSAYEQCLSAAADDIGLFETSC